MTGPLDRLSAALADRYTIDRELGAGGMATVYLAVDLRHHRQVALKVLRPELAAVLGPQRFLQEIEVTAGLHHPHILPLYDSGAADGQLFYVMPYVEGESLRGRLAREKQLPLDDALQITREVADALSYAHSRGIVHRDIKPENILLESGHAVVADFGIARALTAAGGTRLTETGLAIGTPAYMSPEQAAGEHDLDGRSDLYSLGCVLYEMLSGETPYTGPTPQAILAKKLSEPLPRISVVREAVPPGIEAALGKALARTPADRFRTAADFAAVLIHPETMTPAAPPASAAQMRRPAWRVGLALALVVFAAVGAWLTLQHRGARAVAFAPDLVQLTTKGDVEWWTNQSLSPDGSRLAYVKHECDERERCANRVVVQDTGGAGEITLVRSPFAGTVGWATSGRHLIVGIAGGDSAGVWAWPALGGTPRWLGRGWLFFVVGTSDTVLLTADRAPGDTVVRLRFITASDGATHDSLAVHTAMAWDIGMPAPRGGRVMVMSGSTAGFMFRVVDRAGRLVDSLHRKAATPRGWQWSPHGDALVWAEYEEPGEQQVLVLRHRLGDGGMGNGRIDTLTRLPKGSALVGLTADGAALLLLGSVERTVYALQRSAPGRLDFRIRRVATSTSGLGFSISEDGAWIFLSGERSPQYVMVPFQGGEERTISLPPGQLVQFHMTWPASSGWLALMRDTTGRGRLYQGTVPSGQIRDLGLVPDSTDAIRAVPGGGWLEGQRTRGIIRLRGRPGQADTTWVLPQDPGHRLSILAFSSDAHAFWTTSLNSTEDTAWVRRYHLDGRPAAAPVPIAYMQDSDCGLAVVPNNDGSFEYPVPEPAAGGDGWYRVAPGGMKPVRLGDAPLQNSWWSCSMNPTRLAAATIRNRYDVYLIRNFAQLLQ